MSTAFRGSPVLRERTTTWDALQAIDQGKGMGTLVTMGRIVVQYHSYHSATKERPSSIWAPTTSHYVFVLYSWVQQSQVHQVDCELGIVFCYFERIISMELRPRQEADKYRSKREFSVGHGRVKGCPCPEREKDHHHQHIYILPVMRRRKNEPEGRPSIESSNKEVKVPPMQWGMARSWLIEEGARSEILWRTLKQVNLS